MSKTFSAIQKARSRVIVVLETLFYKWGCFVARRPLAVILASLVFSGLSGLGILNLRFETDGNALWIPKESPFLAHSNWLKDNFEHDNPRRINSLIIEDVGPARNILTDDGIKLMLEIHKLIDKTNPDNILFKNICYRIPIANILSEEDQKRCARVKRSSPNNFQRDQYLREKTAQTNNKRQIRQSGIEYDNAGFDYNYNYDSGDSNNDEKQEDYGFFGNFFNRNRNEAYKVEKEVSTKMPPQINSEEIKNTSQDESIFTNILKEFIPSYKPSTSKLLHSSEIIANSIQPSTQTLKVITSTESIETLTTTENSEPVDYDCGDFCGDYDYKFNTTEEEAAHNNFGAFGALFSTFKNYLSFATLDTCQKDIAYKIPLEQYCSYVKDLETKCFEQSLLEMWNYNENIVNALTEEDIIGAINQYDRSPYFGYAFNYTSLLGGIKTNVSHGTISAASAMYNLATTVDLSRIVSSSDTQNAGTEFFPLDKENLVWQKEVIKELTKLQEKIDSHTENSKSKLKIRINMSRSYTDVASSAIFMEVFKIILGYILMFVYTSTMLGRFNILHQRFYLTFSGIFSVVLGILVSVGWSGILGFPYTPMHAILPFLMIGIGIDNMFVIVQCWYNLNSKELNNIEEEMGLAMKHAGVSITVTSFTDVCAFAVGCITILPGLTSFCMTCAIGIAATYILQITFFTACLSIDTMRIKSKRNGCCPCYGLSPDWEPFQFTKLNYSEKLLKMYSSLLHSNLYRTLVLLITTTIFAFGLYGTITIKQEFDEVKMLPSDSYLRQWFDAQQELYPTIGTDVKIYTGALDPETDLEKMDKLIDELESLVNQEKYLTSVDSWWTEFKTFLLEKYQITNWKTSVILKHEPFQRGLETKNMKTFSFLLSDFLFTPIGAKYKEHFVLNGTLFCNEEAPAVLATSTLMVYRRFEGREEYMPATRFIKELIDTQNFSCYAFPFSHVYRTWETVEIIGFELWRNLGLALACVFAITFVLLAETRICLMVFTCVALTLVDVVGALSFWKTTLDPLSSVNIILAVGLCIDYPAHIAHSFLVATGSSVQRAQCSLMKICPAVLNGGMTTFLALIVLADSNSHAFLTFFKVFFLTVLFGMYHGVVFLPAILSWIGGDNIKNEPAQSSNNITLATAKTNGVYNEKDKNNNLSILDKIIIYITGIKANSDT